MSSACWARKRCCDKFVSPLWHHQISRFQQKPWSIRSFQNCIWRMLDQKQKNSEIMQLINVCATILCKYCYNMTKCAITTQKMKKKILDVRSPLKTSNNYFCFHFIVKTFLTWKTASMALPKSSKLDLGGGIWWANLSYKIQSSSNFSSAYLCKVKNCICLELNKNYSFRKIRLMCFVSTGCVKKAKSNK